MFPAVYTCLQILIPSSRALCRYHEHCPVVEILVFGRETRFPSQTLQRWYMCKSPKEMETNLVNVFKATFEF
jgi:hypothetical protein